MIRTTFCITTMLLSGISSGQIQPFHFTPTGQENECTQFFELIRQNLDGHFVLDGDLVCGTNENIEPIGDYDTARPFTGTFDGQGNTIHNLTIHWPDRDRVGLFSFVCDDAVLKDLTFNKANIQGKAIVGTIIGLASHRWDFEGQCAVFDGKPTKWVTVDNVHVLDSQIKGYELAAGMIGSIGLFSHTHVESSTLNNLSLNNTVINVEYMNAGGIVAQLAHADVNTISVNNAHISADSHQAGGLAAVASAETHINNASINATLSGRVSVGGVAGHFVIRDPDYSSGSITNSYANVDISSGGSTGGLVGTSGDIDIYKSSANATISLSSSAFYVGGLIGTADRGTVKESYANSKILLSANKGNTRAIGGLIGNIPHVRDDSSLTTISNSYATGEIIASIHELDSYDIGGLIGRANGELVVSHSYSTTKLKFPYADPNLGGLIGYNYQAKVNTSFWNRTDSGVEHSDGGTEATQAQMRAQAFYENQRDPWCFKSNCGDQAIWKMGGNEYPYPILINSPKLD